MTPERWQCVKDVFDAVVEDPARREEILRERCGDDAGLRTEIESLLEQHGRPGATADWQDAVAASAAALPDADSLVGKAIGAYRLERVLGAGGMGVVYLAQRDDSFQKQVALKVIRSGIYSEAIIRRFEAERQILAGFDHPHIAHLLDGGATEDGSPYLVMEYVAGTPLDRYCEEHGLSTSARLALFLDVCDAVSYAHRNLVVHRDLKPGNILVDGEGTVKLLDFGIAKVLQPTTELPRESTVTEHRLLTPDYASPEQLLGKRIGADSDIYSLGAILYRVLTGTTPRQGETIATLESLQHDPAAPSTVAAKRGDKRLQTELRGDLDTIVLTALQFDPQRRYHTADALAADIRRYLSGWPISARPDTMRYRARKFVARNRAGVAAGALIAVTLVAGIAATSWQAVEARKAQARAERRFNEVRSLAHSLLFEYDAKITDLAGATSARELLVRDALRYLESLSRDTDDPTLTTELAVAYSRVGEIQGNPYASNLGRTADATKSYSKAMQMLEPLVAERPNDRAALVALARATSGFGDTLYQGEKLNQSRAAYERAAELWKRIVQLGTPNAEEGISQMFVEMKLGDICGNPYYANLGDPKQSIRRYQHALDLNDQLLRRFPSDERVLRGTSQSLAKLATIYDATGDYAAAAATNVRAVEYAERLARKHPNVAGDQNDLSLAYTLTSMALRKSGRNAEALSAIERAAAIMQGLADRDPASVLWPRNLSVIYGHVAATRLATRDYAGALQAAGHSRALARKLFDANVNADAAADLAISIRREGEALLGMKRYDEAEKRLTEAHALASRYHTRGGRCEFELGVIEARLAQADRARGAIEEARGHVERSRSILEPLAKQGDARARQELESVETATGL